MTTNTFAELEDIVLKNKYFQLLDELLKKWVAAIKTKFTPSSSFLFIADLEERFLSDIDPKPYIW